MIDAERRERARLRSERWRRAHGIMPRRPAQRPWVAMGVSRSTWYRRGNRVRKTWEAGVNFPSVQGKQRQPIDLSRALAFTRQLQAELAEVDRCQAVTAAIIAVVVIDKSTAFALPEWRALKVHPFAALFPPITGEEWSEFVADIKTNGLMEPCALDKEGTLIDGRNRLRACELAGVEPRFECLNAGG
jgi:hypothetical protein